MGQDDSFVISGLTERGFRSLDSNTHDSGSMLGGRGTSCAGVGIGVTPTEDAAIGVGSTVFTVSNSKRGEAQFTLTGVVRCLLVNTL